MISFMQIISKMYGFHVGLGDINIERQTGPNDSASGCGVILHIPVQASNKVIKIKMNSYKYMKNDAAARGTVFGTGLSFNVNIS